MRSHFIWSVKDKVIETEEAHNVTYRWIQQKKLEIAVKYHCAYDEVVMVYKIDEGKT